MTASHYVNFAARARSLAEEKLSSSLPVRWSHVQAVADKAQSIAKVFAADGELLVAAAALHDIGYAPDIAYTGFHPIDGARYLRSIDAPSRLVNLIAHHSYSVVEAETSGLSAELAEFSDEETPLRDALWWADLTTGPTGQSLTFEERMGEIRQRYGPGHPVVLALDASWEPRQAAVYRTEKLLKSHGLL